MMVTYNQPFFKLFENVFLILKERYGEDTALTIFKDIMEKGLKSSYGNNFKWGDTETLVGDRDQAVGLKVAFHQVSDNYMEYRFYDDPFPGLKNCIAPSKLDETYMRFKVNYILGKNWDFETTKHLWLGDDYTEHKIFSSPMNLDSKHHTLNDVSHG